MSDQGYALGWDDEIQHESPDFVTVPEGEYEFEVIEFERARHEGSAKLPPCNKAVVHIDIKNDLGKCVIKHNLFLHSRTEGLLTNFFTGIGQRRKGERIAMNWNAVVGARGRARVGVRTYTTDHGESRTINEIKRFIEPDDVPTSTPQAPQYRPGSF